MRVFKRQSKRADGTKSKSSKWTIELTDHDERIRRVVAFTDRAASLEAGRKIMRLVGAKLGGMQPEPDLVKWLETCPNSIRLKLAKWRIIDGQRVAATKGIAEHVTDYETALGNRGGTAQHQRDTTARIRSVVQACKIKTLSGLTAQKISNDLARRRSEGRSVRTSNHYLTAMKMFCRWLVQNGRLSADPLTHLRAQNADVDRRKVRRALTPDEARRLIDTATNEPERYEMAGADRGLLYRVAIESGLRANELRHLIRADFDLVSESPSVRVRAVNAKNRKEQRVPLRPEMVQKLQDCLGLVHPGAVVFSMPAKGHIAEMLRADLKAARDEWIGEVDDNPDEWEKRERSEFLSPENSEGQSIDFHALRHTCASWLAANGVPITTAQKILRHSTIELTANVYTHTGADQKADAVASLPNLDPRHGRESNAATGTHGREEMADSKCARHKAQNDRIPADSGKAMRLPESRSQKTNIDANPCKTRVKPSLQLNKGERPEWDSNPRITDLQSVPETAQPLTEHDLQLSENEIGAPQGAESGETPISGADSGATDSPEITLESQSAPDPGLARLIDLWADLTSTVRRSLVALAEGAAKGSD